MIWVVYSGRCAAARPCRGAVALGTDADTSERQGPRRRQGDRGAKLVESPQPRAQKAHGRGCYRGICGLPAEPEPAALSLFLLGEKGEPRRPLAWFALSVMESQRKAASLTVVTAAEFEATSIRDFEATRFEVRRLVILLLLPH
jgi:hypothetical protein